MTSVSVRTCLPVFRMKGKRNTRLPGFAREIELERLSAWFVLERRGGSVCLQETRGKRNARLTGFARHTKIR